MKDVLNWCVENYRILIDVLAIIVLFVLAIFKKKPVKDITSVIFTLCIKGVKLAEKTGLKDIAKLEYCVKYVKDQLLLAFPNLDVIRYVGFISKTIELILTTPQKTKLKEEDYGS